MVKKVVSRLIHLLPFFILVVAFPFFFFGGALESSSSFFGAIWDCGHLVFFIALVIVINKKIDVNNWRVSLIITATVFFGGGLIEVIQANIGRDGNWDDLLRDLTGTWLGLFWLQHANRWVWVGRVVAIGLLIPNLAAVFFESWYQLYSWRTFPMLASFESAIEFHWRKKGDEQSSQYHTDGKYSLKVELPQASYPGIKFSRLWSDWRGYHQLSVDIYNPDVQAFDMTIRVNDREHKQHGWHMSDRFNKKFHLEPGWNHLAFPMADIEHAPAGRLMDLSRIAWVEIFATNVTQNRVIYLDNLRLE